MSAPVALTSPSIFSSKKFLSYVDIDASRERVAALAAEYPETIAPAIEAFKSKARSNPAIPRYTNTNDYIDFAIAEMFLLNVDRGTLNGEKVYGKSAIPQANLHTSPLEFADLFYAIDITSESNKALGKEDFHLDLALAISHEKGIGTAPNESAALDIYRRLVDKNYAPAQNHLGNTYSKKGDHEAAFSLFTQAANQGYSAGQYHLALCHDNELGASKDHARTMQLLKAAADQGLDAAQCTLASIYLRVGVADEFASENKALASKASNLLRLSAGQGYAKAQYDLAEYYHQKAGNSDNNDYLRVAANWYHQAADQGHLKSQCCLARCYYNGNGTQQDNAQTFLWLARAANAGYAPAIKELSERDEDGSYAIKMRIQTLVVTKDEVLEIIEGLSKADRLADPDSTVGKIVVATKIFLSGPELTEICDALKAHPGAEESESYAAISSLAEEKAAPRAMRKTMPVATSAATAAASVENPLRAAMNRSGFAKTPTVSDAAVLAATTAPKSAKRNSLVSSLSRSKGD